MNDIYNALCCFLHVFFVCNDRIIVENIGANHAEFPTSLFVICFIPTTLLCIVYFTFFRYKCQCLICYTKNTCHFFVTALFLSDLIRCCKLPTVAGMCILTWRNRHRSWCQQISTNSKIACLHSQFSSALAQICLSILVMAMIN